MAQSRLSISGELARSPSTLSRAEATALVAYEFGIPVRTDWTLHQLAVLLFYQRLYPDAGAQAWSAACMDLGEWQAWERMNPRTNITLREFAPSPCVDCDDPAFVLARLAEGRCNGIPGPVRL